MIAAINGVAGGLILALFADIRVAGTGARIGDTSGKVGRSCPTAQSLSDAALAVMFVNTGQDAQEGMQAFRERRAPRFEGR